MTPDLERRLMRTHYKIRIEQAERGIRACRAMQQQTRNLRWSREAADWQDVLWQARADLAALETRHGVTPEGTPLIWDSSLAIPADSK